MITSYNLLCTPIQYPIYSSTQFRLLNKAENQEHSYLTSSQDKETHTVPAQHTPHRPRYEYNNGSTVVLVVANLFRNTFAGSGRYIQWLVEHGLPGNRSWQPVPSSNESIFNTYSSLNIRLAIKLTQQPHSTLHNPYHPLKETLID